MKIKTKELPPNWDKIKAKFPVENEEVVVSWGDTVYLPNGGSMTGDLIIHEGVHEEQQKKVGGVERWWDIYLEDEEFRINQEVPAYHAQYEFLTMGTKNREHKALILWTLARSLCKIYATNLSIGEATKLIRENLSYGSNKGKDTGVKGDTNTQNT